MGERTGEPVIPSTPAATGYRSDHHKWWDLSLHAKHETEELGNYFPPVAHLGEGWIGIWVCHQYGAALRYGEIIHEVDLSGAVLFHEDDDDGYFYIKLR